MAEKQKPEGITLRPVCLDDEAFLCGLYATTRSDEMAVVGWGEAQKQAFLKMQYEAQRAHFGTFYPNADHSIILQGERMVGRLFVVRADDEILLADIALLPDCRGGGIGTRMIKGLLAEAERLNKPVRLSVVKSNPALRLYERLGFSIISDVGVHFRMEWRAQPGRRPA